jgi:hypothetical protein
VVTSDASFGDVAVLLGRSGPRPLAPQQRFTTGLDAAGVAAADFDADGRVDLATADGAQAFGTVSVLSQLDPGLGVRLRGRNFRVAPEPQFLTVADFNGDGVPDVVAVGLSTTISLGGGHGGLRAPRRLTARGFVLAATAGDADGDGKVDLIVADDRVVRTLRGKGDGTFRSGLKSAGSNAPSELTTGDVNGDGKLDLLESRYDFDEQESEAGVSLLLGRGDGTFESPREIAGPKPADDAAIADFDGDGRPDVVVRRVEELVVAFGEADGSFRVESVGQLGGTDGAESQLVAADLNGDGAPDVAVATRGANEVRLFMNAGGGGFEAPSVIHVDGGPVVARSADFNGDGVADLAVADFDIGRVSVFTGKGGGAFAPSQTFDVGAYAGSLSIADFNRDGRPDAAVEDTDANRAWILTDVRR